VALAPSSPFRRPRYRGTPARWHALARRLAGGACAAALALAAGGCSFSYQLDNLLAKKGDPDQPGSLRTSISKATAERPAEADLAIAHAALSEILAKGGKDTSMPWENPKTGARGTVTPLASAHHQGGTTCRDFLASYVKDGSESWLQGEACRVARGKWEVRNLRPWKNT
jgi:surface antigen